MSNIADEQNKLLEEYEDTVELSISIPRTKLEKLVSELQRDMLTLSAVPFDPDAEKVNTVKLRSRMAQDLAYYLGLLDEEEEVKPASKKVTGKSTRKRAGNLARKAETAE